MTSQQPILGRKLHRMILALEGPMKALHENLIILRDTAPNVTSANIKDVSQAFETFQRTQLYRVGDQLSDAEKEYMDIGVKGKYPEQVMEAMGELLAECRLAYVHSWKEALTIKFHLDQVMFNEEFCALDVSKEGEERGGGENNYYE